MILPGTYHNGFAPRDGEPLFPELWRGCVGAWNPGLGPSGLTLRDWSPYKNHGTLAGPAAWLPNQGKYSVNFSGAGFSSRIDAGSNAAATGGECTVSGWMAFDSTNTNNPLLCKGSLEGNSTSTFALYWNVVAGFRFFVVNNSNTLGIVSESTVTTPVLKQWYHIAGIADGTTIRIYVNGRFNNSASSSVTARTNSTQVLYSGVDSTLNIAREHRGDVDGLMVYNRALSNAEIHLLASRRGIAYEMIPSQLTGSEVLIAAYRARQYSQIIGGGVI